MNFRKAGIVALFAILAVACGAENTLLEERSVTTNGNFRGLSIGMTKVQALEVAHKLGSRSASPIPCISFRASNDSIGDLSNLAKVEGIRVTNYGSSTVDIFFSNDKVSSIGTFPTTNPAPMIVVGMKVGTVRENLGRVLSSSPDLIAYPISRIDRADTLALDQLSTPGSQAYLQSHVCWEFEVSTVRPAGEYYELYFGEYGLEKISYRRPRVRID